MNINLEDLYNIFKIIFVKYFQTIRYNMDNLEMKLLIKSFLKMFVIELKKYQNKIYS